MKQYSIDRVEAAFYGLDLKPGFAAGTTITETRSAPTWTKRATGNGRIVRVYNPDRSGTLTILVDQESDVHNQLRILAAADRLSRNVVGTLTVKDTSSGELFYYKNAYISTEPDEVRGTEAATYAWVFEFESVEHVPLVSLANFIGS